MDCHTIFKRKKHFTLYSKLLKRPQSVEINKTFELLLLLDDFKDYCSIRIFKKASYGHRICLLST